MSSLRCRSAGWAGGGGDPGRNHNGKFSPDSGVARRAGLGGQNFQGGDLADGPAEEQQDQDSDPERHVCFVGLDAESDEVRCVVVWVIGGFVAT